MEQQAHNVADGTRASANNDEPKWKRGSIEFPYSDIGRAQELVRALFEHGGGSAEYGQLAAWMDQTVKSGSFRAWLSAARLFGFVETDRESIQITKEGHNVIESASAEHEMALAFLRVPLFRKLFQLYGNHLLPGAPAIEKKVIELGVPPKQGARARQVFQKSARLAGYLTESNRLVKPTAANMHSVQDSAIPLEDTSPTDVGGDTVSESPYHPFIEGLLRELPDTKEFSEWSVEGQAEWLRAAASIFRLLSKASGEIEIKISSKGLGPGDRSRPGQAVE